MKKDVFHKAKRKKKRARTDVTQSPMSGIANEIKIGHRETLDYAMNTIDFHIESHQSHIKISSYICKISPSCFYVLLTQLYETRRWNSITLHVYLQFSEWLLLELNMNALENSKRPSSLLVTTGTVVTSDSHVRMCLLSFKTNF